MTQPTTNNKSKGCLKGCLIGFLIVVGSFIFLCIVAALLIPETTDNIYKKANSSYKKEEFLKALKLIDKAIKNDSVNPKYHLLKGMILSKKNDTILSEKEIELAKTLAMNDSLKQIIFKKIIAWRIQKNDTLKAEKLLHFFLKPLQNNDFKNYADSYYYVAHTMVLLDKSKKSATIFTSFIDSIQKLKRDTLNFKKAHYRVSKELLTLGDTIQSITILKRLLTEYPNATLAYKNIGDRYLLIKSPTKAIPYFKKYITIDTTDSSVYTKIGQSYSRLQNNKNAIKYLKIATEKGDHEACSELKELTAKTRYDKRSKCCDGTSSYSTGRGTCSHHGGVCGVEYVPYKVYTTYCN